MRKRRHGLKNISRATTTQPGQLTPSPNHRRDEMRGEKNIVMPWGRPDGEGREGRHGEGVQRGSRAAHRARTPGPRYFSPSVDRRRAPAHVEKRRHGGRIKSAQRRNPRLPVPPPPPHSLLDRSTAPLLRPRRPEEDEPRRRRRARVGSANPSPSPVVVPFVFRWAGGSGRPEMMDEAPADLRELVRLPDVLVVCSSTGWTDEKHMLYLQLLEETFVSKLHGGERSFKGLFNLSPRYCRQVKLSKQIVECAKPDQGYLGIVDADRVKSCMKVELMDSPSCCGNQQDGNSHSTDDNASTTEPVEEAISQARTTGSGQSSTCYVGKHRHSPSRSADFYKRTTRAFTQRGRIRILMRRPKGQENQEEDAAKSD